MLYCEDKCLKSDESKCDLKNKGFCLRKFKLDSLCKNALLTEQQMIHIDLRIDADGTDKEAFIKLKNIGENIEDFVSKGKNLLLRSSITGNGKTLWSIRLLQNYFTKIWYLSDSDECKGLFIHVPRFLLSLKDAISEKSDYIDHIKRNVLDADLVVFDEIGTKTTTSFESENLLNIINTRINAGKSNIYTTNLRPEELKDKLGDRLYSRIFNLSTDIELFGKDKRILAKR